MKIALISLTVRLTLFSAVLAVTTRALADNRLARNVASNLPTGTMLVDAAGPYVEAGTFRIQVADKLGRPSAVLPDGTWLYQNFATEDGQMTGTLVVRFTKGRVTSLALATPEVVALLRKHGGKTDQRYFASSPSPAE